jgi:hypothetical protein
MLAPHYTENAKFGIVGFPSEDPVDLRKFLIGQPVLDRQRRIDFNFLS